MKLQEELHALEKPQKETKTTTAAAGSKRRSQWYEEQ